MVGPLPFKPNACSDAVGLLCNHDPFPAYLRERDIRGSKPRGAKKHGGRTKAPTPPRVIDIAHSTLWDWVRKGKFPPPVKLSVGVTAWRAADVAAWAEGRWTPETESIREPA